jgi:hypothetical protein
VNTLFRESFHADLSAITDVGLLRRIKKLIEQVETAPTFQQIPHLKRLDAKGKWFTVRLAQVSQASSHFDQMNGATGKPEEMLLRVGVKNIGYVQFCDTDSTLRDGGTSKHLGCGDGRIDCAKSLRILKEGGFREWLMEDEWEVPDPYDACLKCENAFEQTWQ